MDRDGASLEVAVQSLADRLGVTALPRGVPVEIDLVGEIDPFGFPDKSN